MKKIKMTSLFCAALLLLSLLTPMSALAVEGQTADPNAADIPAQEGDAATPTDIPAQSPEPEDTVEQDAPDTKSRCVLLLNADTGAVLYSKNADVQLYPASLTKIMTVLLAVEAIERGEKSADDMVTCAGNIAYDMIEDGSTSGIVAGETMSLKSLMYCAMVASANEACNAIAAYISGSIPDFIALMNSRAAELGCTATHFANTHGLPNTSHYTTASDLGKIAEQAHTHPLFMEICNTAKITIPPTNVAGERQLSNTNGLINPESPMYPGYSYEYAAGIKTGHTSDAGYCLISTAKKDNKSLLCVITGGDALSIDETTQYSSFTDTITIYDWAFDYFDFIEVLKTTDLLAEIPLNHGKNAKFVNLSPLEPISVLMAQGGSLDSLEQDITLYEQQLEAPIAAGTVYGEVTLLQNGKVCGTTQLIASEDIEISVGSQVTGFVKKPVIIVIIAILALALLVYIILIANYHSSRKKYLAEQQRRKAMEERRAAQRPRDPREDEYFNEFFKK